MQLNNIEKQASLRENFRLNEAKRKERIFNPKVRLIGIDKDELDKQVLEKNKKRETEELREKYFNDLAQANIEKLNKLNEYQEEAYRNKMIELNNYRKIYQKPELSSDFDLNDPDRFKKDLPPRCSDFDDRCGISSLQIFEGEDLFQKERQKLQKDQIVRWYDAQLEDKKFKDWQKQESDKLEADNLKNLDNKMNTLLDAERQSRSLMNKALVNYNKLLSDRRREKREEIQRNIEAINKSEQINSIFGDFLSENPEKGISALGEHRINPMEYKGMSESERKKFYLANDDILREKQRLEEERKRSKNDYDRQVEKYESLIQKLDLDIKDLQKKRKYDILNVNKKLAEEQNKRNQDLNRKINKPTEEFFNQFNTTTR